MAKPLTQPILKVLQPRAKDLNRSVACAIVAALGELLRAGGPALLPAIDDLIELCVETLQDQASPEKRHAALRALGRIAT